MPDHYCPNCRKIFSVQEGSDNGNAAVCSCGKTALKLLPAGTVLGGCRIISHISCSGQVSLYHGEQIAIKRQILLKVLDTSTPDGAAFLGKFLESARNSVKYTHPAIVSVINAGRQDSLYYNILPCIPGKTLAEILEAGRIYRPEEALSLLCVIGEALQSMWQKQNVCHGKLSPDNIMISSDGDPFLIDFWDRREENGDLFPELKILPFTAPECMEKPSRDPSGDLYTFGAILFYMTRGIRPFQGLSKEEILLAHYEKRSFTAFTRGQLSCMEAFSAETSKSFNDFQNRLIAPDPAGRIKDWAEFLETARALEKHFSIRPAGHCLDPMEVKPVIPLSQSPASPAAVPIKTESKKEEAPAGQPSGKISGKKKKEEKRKKEKRKFRNPLIPLLRFLLIAGGLCAGYYLTFYYPYAEEIITVKELIADANTAWEEDLNRFPGLCRQAHDYAVNKKVTRFVKDDLKKLDEKYDLIAADLSTARAIRGKYNSTHYAISRELHRLGIGLTHSGDSENAIFTTFSNFDKDRFARVRNEIQKKLEAQKKQSV